METQAGRCIPGLRLLLPWRSADSPPHESVSQAPPSSRTVSARPGEAESVSGTPGPGGCAYRNLMIPVAHRPLNKREIDTCQRQTNFPGGEMFPGCIIGSQTGWVSCPSEQMLGGGVGCVAKALDGSVRDSVLWAFESGFFVCGTMDDVNNCHLFPFAGDSGITEHKNDFIHSHLTAD